MNIFEKDLNLDEVNEILKESMETSNIIKKKTPIMMFNMAKKTYVADKAKEKIKNKMYKDSRNKVTNITLIDDNSAIIETFEKMFDDTERNWYRVYYNGEIDSSVTTKFDIALLHLVAVKNNNSEATMYMSRLVDLKEDIE